jgi:hypothetical protein
MKNILAFLLFASVAFGQVALDVSVQQVNAGGTAFAEVLVPGESAITTTLASWRSAFGLGTEDAVVFSGISGTTGTFSTLTSGRVPFASAAGLLIDSATLTFSAGTLTATTFSGALSGNATTATNVAVGGITGLGANVGTFLAIPSSANLASALTDETGTGAAVFATAPTFSGVITSPGSFISAPDPITITEASPDTGTLDITKKYSTATIDEATTISPSAAGTNGQTASIKYTNTTGAVVVATMNNSGTDYTSNVPANASIWITYVSNGTDWVPTLSDPAAGTVASTSLLYGSVAATRTDETYTVSSVADLVRTTIVEKIAVFSVDGGGSAITTGTVAGTARVPFACTLTGYSITATAATGTNTIKIWAKATATSIPVTGDSINTSGVSLSTGTAVASATLSDFTDTVYAAGDMMRCSVTAVDGAATDLTVTLYGTRL